MAELDVNVVGGGGDRLLVLIHGFGADEHDLAPLSTYLDPAGRFHAVCPRGPESAGPYGGAAWYQRSNDGMVDQLSFCAALVGLDQLVDSTCQAHGFDVAETVIVGFSQGAAMTLALGLRRTTRARPAAIAALSGSLQQPAWLVYDWDADDLPPVYLHHGEFDPVVDVDRGRTTEATLRSHGLRHHYREYPMQHEINLDSLTDLAKWIDDNA